MDSDPDRMARAGLAWFWTRRAAVVAPVNPWLLRHLLTRGGVTGSGQGEEEEPGHLALAVPPPSLLDRPRPRPAPCRGLRLRRLPPAGVPRGRPHPGGHGPGGTPEPPDGSLGGGPPLRRPRAPVRVDGWRAGAGLPRKELDLLVEWARLAVAPPLADAFANVQEKAIETVLAPQFVKLGTAPTPRPWPGRSPPASTACGPW